MVAPVLVCRIRFMPILESIIVYGYKLYGQRPANVKC